MNTEEISRKVMDAADMVGKKTVSLLEEGKLLFKIREIERSMDRSYRKIGRYLYENNRELLDGALAQVAENVDADAELLAVLQREYAEMRGMKFCENCHTLNKETSVYCNQCGERFD